MAKYAEKTDIELFVINQVVEMRIKSGISQPKLAHKLDLSVGFIGHI